VGTLLQDLRRLNVAFTRAKSKLLLLGSRRTLARCVPALAQLLKLCEQRRWVVQLPHAAATAYPPPMDAAWRALEAEAPPLPQQQPRAAAAAVVAAPRAAAAAQPPPPQPPPPAAEEEEDSDAALWAFDVDAVLTAAR